MKMKRLTPFYLEEYEHLKKECDRAMDQWLQSNPPPDAKQKYFIAKERLQRFTNERRSEGYLI